MKTIKIIILITIANFFFNFGNQMSLPTFTPYLASLNTPIEYIGALSFVVAIAALIFRPIAAHLIDKIGARNTTIIGAIVAAISFIGFNVLNTLMPTIIVRLIQGASVGLFSTAAPTLLSQSVSEDSLLKYLSRYTLVSNAASSIGPYLGFYLISGGSFSPFFYMGIAVNVLAMLFLFPIENHIYKHQEEEQVIHTSIFKSKAVFPALGFIFYMIVQSGLMSYLTVHGAHHGIDNVGFFYMFSFLGIILAQQTITHLLEKLHLIKSIILIGLVFSGSLILLAQSDHWIVWSLLSVLLAFSFNSSFMMYSTLAVKHIHPSQRGKANALFFGGVDIAFFSGAFIWGQVALRFNTDMIYLIAAGLIIVAIIINTTIIMIKNIQF